MRKFQSKTASFIITLFIGAILISFALTGFDGFNSTTGSVATVDGAPISTREYQSLLARESERYSQIFGGKSLTNAQIRQFRISENVINQLIQQKLILNLGSEIDLGVGEEQLKSQIKNQEFFQTNNQFDVNKYKAILSANRLTPSSYEETVIQDELLKQSRDLLSNIPVSRAFVKANLELSLKGASVNTVEFSKEDNSKFVNVSQKEISNFSGDEKNQKLLESLFNTMATEFNKPEEVKAKHILIKTSPDSDGKKELKKAQSIFKSLTTKNFSAIANKETEDPSGKGKGGDLGWFSKGRMVPEFENAAFAAKVGSITEPIKTSYGYHIIYVQDKKKAVTKTLADVKNIVAQRHLQRTKRDELKKFNSDLVEEVKMAMSSKNQLKKLVQKYSLKLSENQNLSYLTKNAGSLTLKDETIQEILKNQKVGSIVVEDSPADIKIISLVSIKSAQDIEKEIKTKLDEEISTQIGNMSAKLQQDLLAKLQEEASIKTYLSVQ